LLHAIGISRGESDGRAQWEPALSNRVFAGSQPRFFARMRSAMACAESLSSLDRVIPRLYQAMAKSGFNRIAMLKSRIADW